MKSSAQSREDLFARLEVLEALLGTRFNRDFYRDWPNDALVGRIIDLERAGAREARSQPLTLREKIEVHLKAHGWYTELPGFMSEEQRDFFWTCPEYENWWNVPSRSDHKEHDKRRYVTFEQAVTAQIDRETPA